VRARDRGGQGSSAPRRCDRRTASPNINVDEQPQLAAAFQLQTILTLVVLRDGRLLGTDPGAVSADQLVDALDQVAA
jgi:thioredoxin-like negative regulator of GroEL